MIPFLVRRISFGVLTLLVVTAVAFAIFFLLPRAAGQTTDQMAARYLGRDPDPVLIANLKEKLGFDDPLPVQYGRFLKGLVAGADYDQGPDKTHCPAPCLGYSFRNDEPVTDLIIDRAPVTFSIVSGGSIVWLVSGVTIGVVSALRRGSLFDRAAMIGALAGVSLPTFFTALLALMLFRPILGDVVYVPFTSNPALWMQNMLLPWLTLALLQAALYARLTRAGMLETMGEDFIRTAHAKGLSRRRVIVRHGLRASLTPIVTIFGMDLGIFLGGAVLTESAYSMQGLGRLSIDAINGSDLPVVLGVTLVTAFFVVVASIVVDAVYAVIDPRVRTA